MYICIYICVCTYRKNYLIKIYFKKKRCVTACVCVYKDAVTILYTLCIERERCIYIYTHIKHIIIIKIIIITFIVIIIYLYIYTLFTYMQIVTSPGGSQVMFDRASRVNKLKFNLLPTKEDGNSSMLKWISRSKGG